MADKGLKTTIRTHGSGVRVILDSATGTTTYQVDKNGATTDRSGADLTGPDIVIVVTALRSSGRSDLANRVTTWWNAR